MIAVRSCLFLAWALLVQGAVTPDARYNLPEGDEGRSRQLFYLQTITYPNQVMPHLQRLELTVDNPDAEYYNPGQRKQAVASSSLTKTTDTAQTSAKLETLEPDAELVPGIQQEAQKPPTQVPVAPPSGIPGLLPGQQVYIVHPQHQLFPQSPLYPQLPNGFRPNIQVPGYQRFFIVPAAPGVQQTAYSPQGGYQNTILIDPTVQTYLQQPGYQRLVGPSEAPHKTESRGPQAPNGEFLRSQEQSQYVNIPQQHQFAIAPQQNLRQFNGAPQQESGQFTDAQQESGQYVGAPQQGQFVGAQQGAGQYPAIPQQGLRQFTNAPQQSLGQFAGAPQQGLGQFGALPQFAFREAPLTAETFARFSRPLEFAFQQNGIRNDYQFGKPSAQLLSFQSGQAQAQQEQAKAQGRNDDRDVQYSNDEPEKDAKKEESSNSSEEVSSEATAKDSDEKPEVPLEVVASGIVAPPKSRAKAAASVNPNGDKQ